MDLNFFFFPIWPFKQWTNDYFELIAYFLKYKVFCFVFVFIFEYKSKSMIFSLCSGVYGVSYSVTRVFFESDFFTVTKSEDTSWDLLKPETFAAIVDFYSSGQPLFLDTETVAAKDTAIHEDDSETVAMIKELSETPIRPTVQDDSGDIEYRGFDLETGIVTLRMQGACSGYPSSSVTLKLTQLEHVPFWSTTIDLLSSSGEQSSLRVSLCLF
ncbi:hypothetical protein UlMin_041138 [Ulmus minor]